MEFLKKGSSLKFYDTLYQVNAENITPVFAGGPDGNTVTSSGEWWGLRPTALRGVWKWWVRALLSGLLWERGYTCDYKAMARFEEVLGLGSLRRRSEVFLDVLSLEYKSPPCTDKWIRPIRRYCNYKGRIIIKKLEKDYLNNKNVSCSTLYFLFLVDRIRLLTTGMRCNSLEIVEFLKLHQPIMPGKVSLSVAIRTSNKEYEKYGELYKNALILALFLGGVGQITSRGFGKFMVHDNFLEKNYLSDNLVKTFLERIEENIDIDNLININKNKIELQKVSEKDFPIIPTFHPDKMKYEVLKEVRYIEYGGQFSSQKKYSRNIWDVLISVNRAVLKNYWKIFSHKKPSSLGDVYHTWVLGLPRSIVEKGGLKTGYFIKSNNGFDEGRWQSSIRFTPIESIEPSEKESRKRKFGTIVYSFITRDLMELYRGSKLLYHFSKKRGHRKVHLINVFDPVTGKYRKPGQASPYYIHDVAFRTIVKMLR